MTVPFTDVALDRADARRKDPGGIADLWRAPEAEALVFWRGRPLLSPEGGPAAPALVPVALLPEDPFVRLFLGMEEDRPVLAIALDPAVPAPEAIAAQGTFSDLRATAGHMDLADGSRAGAARWVFAWHRTHRFCGGCGAQTTVGDAGWKRVCAPCQREHFPRVEPVVIMAITHDDRLLLGRAPSWPVGMFSCLAGFVEPGETIEDAARREALEEASVRIGRVSYQMSQPWPFPASLMLGLHAEADHPDVTVDANELAEARWFGRDEVAQLLDGTHTDAMAPPAIALAHHLMRWWIAT